LGDPDRPNVASTIFRTVQDLTSGRYYFESTYAPNVVGVDIPQRRGDQPTRTCHAVRVRHEQTLKDPSPMLETLNTWAITSTGQEHPAPDVRLK
jgi:penicillin V acylase-like amidase (Ntn superfamily)